MLILLKDWCYKAISIEGSMSNILEAIGQGNKDVLKDWCYVAVSIDGSMSNILGAIGQGNEAVLADTPQRLVLQSRNY